MSTTTEPVVARAVAPAQDEPPMRNRRSRWFLWLGILIMALGAVVGAWLFTQGQNTVKVVTIRSSLVAGQKISASQLGTAALPAHTGLRTVPATDLDGLVGQYAAISLPAGSLMSRDAATDALTPAAGSSIVGVGVKSSQMPARGLSAGDRVRVVVTASGGGAVSSGTASAGTSWAGTVVDTGAANTSGVSTVDVAVAQRDATAVAGAAGTGAIALVLDAR